MAQHLTNSKDIALAYDFTFYAAAKLVADKNATDDPDWDYRAMRVAGRWVVAVYDNSEGNFVFLGYL